MRKFTGEISVKNFDFEVEDDATEEEIEAEAQRLMFDVLDWNFTEETATAGKEN